MRIVKMATLAILIATSAVYARSPSSTFEMDEIGISGNIRNPVEREADKRREGSPRNPIGDGRLDGGNQNNGAQLSGPDPRAISYRETLERLKITLAATDDLGLDALGGEVGHPNGRVLWFFREIALRLLVDGGLAPAHPMEDPRTFRRDPYTLERVVRLKNELAAESDAAWKSKPPKQMEEAATRSFSVIESNLIDAAFSVSPEAGAAAVFILRLGRISSPMLAMPSPAVEKFLDAQAVPSANACWSAESKRYVRIPLTVPMQNCPSFWPNGAPTRFPGITMYRPLGKKCSVSASTACELPGEDVAGANCFCSGPGFTHYGKVVAKRPVGFTP